MKISNYTRHIMLAVAAAVGGVMAVLVALLFVGLVHGGVAQVEGKTPLPPSQPCGGAVVFGSGGSQCDGPAGPDGSFQRCTSVYVMGFGGWSCYTVYP